MNIVIPDDNDMDWQVEMLRRLAIKMQHLRLYIEDGEPDEAEIVLEEAEKIVDALRDYSGH